ncbi:MAG: TetR/AcrR family transcriptional regulator [Actinobacteria bacterium]|nr:TetR/AcrR family transcriptional regulator [Actinomycetota bacterium]
MTSGAGGHIIGTGGTRTALGPSSSASDPADARSTTTQLASTVAPGSTEERVVDAMFACIARWGLAKTTVEDVARTAGISRATVYRLFPGGKSSILEAGLATEITRLVAALSEQLEEMDDLESCLGRAIGVATVFLRDHEALAYVREHEWSAVESFLAHDRLDALFLLAGTTLGPSLLRFLPPEQAGRVAVWAARMVVSYLLSPSEEMDLGDEATARRVVATYLLPGLGAAA